MREKGKHSAQGRKLVTNQRQQTSWIRTSEHLKAERKTTPSVELSLLKDSAQMQKSEDVICNPAQTKALFCEQISVLKLIDGALSSPKQESTLWALLHHLSHRNVKHSSQILETYVNVPLWMKSKPLSLRSLSPYHFTARRIKLRPFKSLHCEGIQVILILNARITTPFILWATTGQGFIIVKMDSILIFAIHVFLRFPPSYYLTSPNTTLSIWVEGQPLLRIRFCLDKASPLMRGWSQKTPGLITVVRKSNSSTCAGRCLPNSIWKTQMQWVPTILNS